MQLTMPIAVIRIRLFLCAQSNPDTNDVGSDIYFAMNGCMQICQSLGYGCRR